ncbi:hypothetical protein [Neobacillus sp. Marseille-QA0830]
MCTIYHLSLCGYFNDCDDEWEFYCDHDEIGNDSIDCENVDQAWMGISKLVYGDFVDWLYKL